MARGWVGVPMVFNFGIPIDDIPTGYLAARAGACRTGSTRGNLQVRAERWAGPLPEFPLPVRIAGLGAHEHAGPEGVNPTE